MTTPAVTPTTATAAPAATTGHAVVVRPAKPRTHVVVAGETLAAIARKRSISLAALQAANPGIVPKKLRAGQTLNLPAQ